ncbi:MAG TPA: hypothetical protein VGI50_12535, partial [Solirubrobacteraceae bacterium]
SGHYPVVLGELGGQAEVLGAIALAMSNVADEELAPLGVKANVSPTAPRAEQGTRRKRSRSSSRRSTG